ncbi:MAG: hypothetical protein HYV60_13180 [Planctomycetia bacterium]|nr:hypothetical protein [Planctomycetia bacterium]
MLGGDAAGAEESSPLLHGHVRFRPSDAPGFADPAFDDSGWQTVRVDHERLEDHWPLGGTVGWYRWRWRAPPETLASSSEFDGAYLFGSIGEADEVYVYVNGRRIGGLGSISPSNLLAPFQPRLYRVPPAALRWDAENVIAVRVMRFLWTDDPITPPALFGRFDQLRDSIETQQRIQRFVEGLLVGSSALSLISWGASRGPHPGNRSIQGPRLAPSAHQSISPIISKHVLRTQRSVRQEAYHQLRSTADRRFELRG